METLIEILKTQTGTVHVIRTSDGGIKHEIKNKVKAS